MSLAVIMITYNEEFHIGDAIDNVKGIADEIYILDSLSTDKTVDIALEKGAVVLQRPFTNFGDQWNFALTHFPIQSNWTMKMDPDERISEILEKSIKDALSEEQADAFSFIRRLWFMGKPLHVKQEIPRIWKTGTCLFSNVAVNEHPLIDSKVVHINGFLEHYDSRDLHHWLEKQNMYTSMEALMHIQKEKLSVAPKLFGNSLERRMFFKSLFYKKIPGKHFLLWVYFYFAKKAFLSGFVGWYWSVNRVYLGYLIDIKNKEMIYTSRKIILPLKQIGKYHPVVLGTKLQQDIMHKFVD